MALLVRPQLGISEIHLPPLIESIYRCNLSVSPNFCNTITELSPSSVTPLAMGGFVLQPVLVFVYSSYPPWVYLHQLLQKYWVRRLYNALDISRGDLNCNESLQRNGFLSVGDGVQPNISPSISHASMYRKLFISNRNRTNSR